MWVVKGRERKTKQKHQMLLPLSQLIFFSRETTKIGRSKTVADNLMAPPTHPIFFLHKLLFCLLSLSFSFFREAPEEGKRELWGLHRSSPPPLASLILRPHRRAQCWCGSWGKNYLSCSEKLKVFLHFLSYIICNNDLEQEQRNSIQFGMRKKLATALSLMTI